MDKLNTCWFFGDSFTQNLALRYEGPYTDYLGYMPKTWTALISEHFDCNERIVAKGGQSTEKTITDVYKYFSEMKKGDYCFIGDSPSVRFEGVDFYKNIISTYNNESYLVEGMPTKISDKSLEQNEWTHTVPIKKEKTHILLDYVIEFVFNHEELWNEYWFTQIKYIIKNLEKIDVVGVYHTHKKWDDFTTLYEETNGFIDDSHWGEIGNHEFYEYLIDRIEKKDYLINE